MRGCDGDADGEDRPLGSPPVVVAPEPGRGLVPGNALFEKRREGGHVCFFHRFVG